MINVSDARKLIAQHHLQPKTEVVPLKQACGCVLAETILSPIDSPPFSQSAMDGFAFSYDGWDKQSDLKITGESRAGHNASVKLKPEEAVRIFTGAPLPTGADTVVMQERVTQSGSFLSIIDSSLLKGNNVRQPGSQVSQHQEALARNHLLSPASISFLAGLGVDRVKVFSNPTVNIIITGSELIQPGQVRKEAEVFESNSFGLQAALQQLNIIPDSVLYVPDNEEKIREAIAGLLDADILILTAGVSVGDYDFVASALEKSNVRKVFHGVKQKPGKPFYFGVRDKTLVFGLPGNPASALTCFYEYIVDAINNRLQKAQFTKPLLPLSTAYTKRNGLTLFLKGKSVSGAVSILPNQESYKMNSFAGADCLIELDADKEYFPGGDLVKIRMII